MEGIPNWDKMTWQEKREERFRHWLSSPNIRFENEQARQLYKQRVTRFIKAIKMEEPDRVPVLLPIGNYPAYWAGANYRTIMYDYAATCRIWIKYMEAFGDMDTFTGPDFVPSGKIAKVLDMKNQKLPGLGLPEDASINQFVEGEYMKADEYDIYMSDPSDYMVRVNTPRTSGLFESFSKLPPLRRLQPAAWVALLAEPDIRKTFQALMDLADEYRQHERENLGLDNLIKSKGYPSVGLGSLGPMISAPFDHFADTLRGTHGIIMDMYRQPEKLLEAMNRWLDMNIKTNLKNYPMTASPVCMMPLHKGDDTFMSEKQFEAFYWPTLRKLLMAMIEEGLVPMPFAEGRYNKRLKQISDLPKSGVIWYFDQTDMAEAKRMLGNTLCITGNVPSSLVKTGTPRAVKEYCQKLIETCSPGGGYILTCGTTIDMCKMENLQAMMEAAKEYGVYR
jgi:uroporphyrinogen-III decarboxylase